MEHFRGVGSIVIAAALLCGLSTGVCAEEKRWTYFGLRPLGMGNAFVGVADDHNALFYNPAGLARLPEWDVEIINPTISTNLNTIKFAQKASDSGTKKDISLLTDELGKRHFASLPIAPHVVGPHFGIGMGVDDFFSMVVHGDVSVDLEVGATTLIPVGFGFNFLDKKLSLGIAPKVIGRVAVIDRLDMDTISLFLSQSADDTKETSQESLSKKLSSLIEGGWGLGVDVGMLYSPPAPMNPTLGISIADVGSSSYNKLNVFSIDKTPAPRQAAVNTGVSLRPFSYGPMYLLLALDAHMVNQPLDYSHKLNAGAELGLGQVLKFQAGMKEGYPTAGMQLDLWLMTLRLATYAIDHGPVVGLNENFVERRIALQLNLLI